MNNRNSLEERLAEVNKLVDIWQPNTHPPNFIEHTAQWINIPIQNRLIHIHLPKTGGTTINKTLESLGVESPDIGFHMTCRTPQARLLGDFYTRDMISARRYFDRLDLSPVVVAKPKEGHEHRIGTYDKALRFSAVRNPFAVLLSSYFYQGKKGDLTWGQGISTFEDWIKKWCDPEFPWRDPFRRKFMWHQLFNEDGDPGVHYVLRQERLTEALDDLLHATNVLPKRQSIRDLGVTNFKVTKKMGDVNSPSRKDYRSFYTDEMRELVETFCIRELISFGYDFDGPVDNRVIINPGYLKYGLWTNKLEFRAPNGMPVIV